MAHKALAVTLVSILVALVGAPASGSTAPAQTDPLRAQQWGLDAIEADGAWAISRGAGAVVAVVDTGVDLDHPDLAANVMSPGIDFAVKGDLDGADDTHGHGTHVAGIAAAVGGNGIGVSGTAPRAQILPVRVLEGESGSTTSLSNGIRWAADMGAHVINVSLSIADADSHASGLQGRYAPVHKAIEAAWAQGAVVVASAGNDSFPLCSQPAAAATHVVCVGASDRRDLPAHYSNFDAAMRATYLVAPGGEGTFCEGEIVSTYLPALESSCSEPGYEGLSGTSMAAPFVSGVAALLASDTMGLTNVEIVDCLKATADDLGPPGRDPVFGYGRLNALAAVQECAPTV